MRTRIAHLVWAAAASANVAAAPGIAQDGGKGAPSAATRFGTRADVRAMSLSPDGRRVAIIRSTAGAGSGLFVVELLANAVPKPILTASGRPTAAAGRPRAAWSAPSPR